MLVESEQCSEEMFTLPKLLEEEFQMTRRASSLVRRHALCQGMRTSIIKRRKRVSSKEVFTLLRLANNEWRQHMKSIA